MCASSSSWEMASARISFSVRLSNERINKLQTGDAPRNRPDFIAPPHRLQAPRSALSLNRKAGQASRLPGSGVAPTWLIPRMYLACTWLAPPNLLPSTWLVPRMYLALSPFLHYSFRRGFERLARATASSATPQCIPRPWIGRPPSPKSSPKAPYRMSRQWNAGPGLASTGHPQRANP
jgi:hypothetical protein